MENINNIDLLLEEINNTTEPLQLCQNYFDLGMVYSESDGHQEAFDALNEAYTIYNRAELPMENALYAEIILFSINELIHLGKYQESFNFIDELLIISPD